MKKKKIMTLVVGLLFIVSIIGGFIINNKNKISNNFNRVDNDVGIESNETTLNDKDHTHHEIEDSISTGKGVPDNATFVEGSEYLYFDEEGNFYQVGIDGQPWLQYTVEDIEKYYGGREMLLDEVYKSIHEE